jgi:hypothetical protein
MSGRTADAILSLIEQVDEVCRESAETRAWVQESMRRRSPYWPERRNPRRWADTASRSPEFSRRSNGENE